MGPGVDPHLDLEAIEACDASSLNEAEAVAVLHRSRRLRGRLDAFDAAVTARLAELHAAGSGAPAADVLSRNGKLSAAEARLRERRGKLLTRTPAFSEALANGRIAAEHADALASAALRLDETIKTELFAQERDLVDHASHHSPEDFARYTRDLIARIERDHGKARAEQQRRDTRLSIRTESDGMTVLNGRFHPELGERITTAIQAETQAVLASSEHLGLDHQQAAAVALANLVSCGNQVKRPGGTDALVVVDLDTLRNGLHERSICETGNGSALSVEAMRRLCCDARIIPVVLGGDGVVLDYGRGQRLASPEQRKALRVMYRTCMFPGCDVVFDRCEIHHLTPWEQLGETNIAEIGPLCPRHHHVVHDDGWTLELDEHRTVTVRRPDSTDWAVQPLSGLRHRKHPPPTPEPDRLPYDQSEFALLG